MTTEQLDELERLEKAADLDPLRSAHIISLGYEYMANLCEEVDNTPDAPSEQEPQYPDFKPKRGRCIGMMPIPWADYLAALRNAAPELIQAARENERLTLQVAERIERLTAECDEWKRKYERYKED